MTRSKAAERRTERQAEKRRQRITSLALIIAGAVVLLVILLVLSFRPADAPIPDGTVARYEGIAQSLTEEGYPRLGDSSAPVIVEEYSSFSCPTCKTFHDEAMATLVERVRGGQMQFIFVPLTTGSVANARGAAAAGICVADQGKFWEMHDAMFSWQAQYGNQAFTNNRIVAGLQALGVDQGAYNACLGSGLPNEVLDRAERDAQGLLNFVGTPTIAINGVVPTNDQGAIINDAATIIERIDQAIAQAGSAASSPEASPEATVEPTLQATEAATLVATVTEAEQEATATPPTEATTAPTPTN
jgi:protein-disulfide isomerase